MKKDNPITAQIVIINKFDQVLCVSRKFDHNDFGLPGGKMETEDFSNPQYTAIRETFEETGINVKFEDMELIFCIHKYGSLSFTYVVTNYTGEINHNEPHVVKWGTWDDLIAGSFGQYNKLVHDSIKDLRLKK
jgi:8-oxo-dGTP pyrophosphatase MutT (NUDIX family)